MNASETMTNDSKGMGAMKKRYGWLIGILACVFALCLVFVGCGGGGGTTTQTAKKDPKADFVGVWEVSSMTDQNGNEDTETIELMKAFGMSVYVVLCDDGTAAVDMYGEVANATWEVSGDTAATLTSNEEMGTGEVTLEDGKLVMESDSGKLIFTKTDEEVPASADKYTSPMESSSSSASETKGTEINKVLVDDETCTIIAVDRRTDGFGDPGYDLAITNKSDKAISVMWVSGSWSVNGVATDPYLWEDIGPQQSVETFAWFEGSAIGDDSNLVNVTGQIEVYDQETTDTIAVYDIKL